MPNESTATRKRALSGASRRREAWNFNSGCVTGSSASSSEKSSTVGAGQRSGADSLQPRSGPAPAAWQKARRATSSGAAIPSASAGRQDTTERERVSAIERRARPRAAGFAKRARDLRRRANSKRPARRRKSAQSRSPARVAGGARWPADKPPGRDKNRAHAALAEASRKPAIATLRRRGRSQRKSKPPGTGA